MITFENHIEPSSDEFWNAAHEYTSNTGEPEFTGEVAFIMTTLHEEGY